MTRTRRVKRVIYSLKQTRLNSPGDRKVLAEVSLCPLKKIEYIAVKLSIVEEFSLVDSPESRNTESSLLKPTLDFLLSAEKGDGRISKQGNAYARFMLVGAAQHFKDAPPVYKRLYQRIKKKKGHNTALVAIARRLAELIWCLLTRNEEFVYSRPRLTDEKRTRVSKLARDKAGLKIARRASNQIVKGTNLRGREIKEEIRRRAADESGRILDLMELGKRLAEASPSGFNPRKPNFTDWHRLLETVARNDVAELSRPTEKEVIKE